MSIRSSLEESGSYRTILSIPSPLPSSRIFRLPSHCLLEFIPILGLTLYMATQHGIGWGLLTALLTLGSVELFFRYPSVGIATLIMAYAAFPRIDTSLRTEDILILALVLAALRKPKPFQTPLDGAITLWLFSIGVSLAGGLCLGTFSSPLQAALTSLKLIEYTIAFYAAYLLRPRLEIPLLLSLLFLGAMGLWENLQGSVRPYNSFPYPAESNHIGGVAVLCIAFAFGGIIGKKGKRMWTLLFLSGLVVVLSQSRIALVALGILLLLQLPHRKTRGIALLLLLLIGGGLFFTPVQNRIRNSSVEWETYRESRENLSEGLPPEFSKTRNRFEVWERLAEDYARFPVLGSGPGSRHRVIYENAYVMLACEYGAIGVLTFALLLFSIFCRLHQAAHFGRDPGSAYGAAFATIVMLTLGITSISFFVSREAGLWWILIGASLANAPPLKSHSPSATVSSQL